MKDGKPRTLAYIAAVTQEPSPSVSARLRELRKLFRGGHLVTKQRNDEGIYEYSLVPNGMLRL